MKNKIKTILTAHNIRLLYYDEELDDFQDTVIRIQPHIMDFFHSDTDAVLDEIKSALNMRVVYIIETNSILAKK